MDPYLNGPTNADTQLACPDFFGPQETSVGVAFWKVQAVKDLRVVDGKREWLIGWAGADDEGDAWPDSWEPSKLLTPDLIDHFL